MIAILEGYKQYTKDEVLALLDKIKAIIYARVSTHDQAEKGYSLQSQVEKGAELARKKFGYLDDEILAIVEKGEMGDNPDRPGLNHVLFLLEEGVGKKLIMLHPDRMSRYLALQNEIASRVWSCGVDLEFVEFEIDPNNPESMLMFNIQGSIAQYNKAKILANSKRGRRQKVKEGKIPGIRRVFGYTYDKELDTLVENPQEKEIYLLMVDWLLNGKDGKPMNCSSIARELAKLNYPAPASDRWYQSTISRVLRNPIYTGKFYYGKSEYIQDKGKRKIVKKPEEEWQSIPIPQYIDERTYQRIQEKLDSLVTKNRGRPSSNYLLKGLVRCGKCGAAIVAGPVTTLKSGKKLRYYVCSKKTKKNYEVGTGKPNETCDTTSWRQDTVDNYVWEYIVSRLGNPEEIIKDIVKQQSDERRLEELKSKLKAIENKIHKKEQEQKRTFKAYREGLISLELFKGEVEPIKQEIEALKEEWAFVNDLYNQITVSYNELERIKQFIQGYREIVLKDQLTLSQKREIVRTIVERVILHQDTIEIITRWSGESKTHSNLNHSQGDGGQQG